MNYQIRFWTLLLSCSHFILSPPRALNSLQVLCLLAALDTSLSRDPFVCEDSRSLLSPRRPLHLYYSVTQFFTYSSSSSFTSSFSYTLLLSQSSVNTVISVCALSRPATLYSKQLRGRSSTRNIKEHKSGLIAYNVKYNPHSITLLSHLILSLLYNCRIHLRKLFLLFTPPLSLSRS